jgi:glucose/arabinose dehydrogenase
MPIRADRIASGFEAPLYATSAPGDPDRLFVVEKNSGRVKILDLDTNRVEAQAFFDVPDAEMTSNGERGLLGLAFHPDYEANGLLYLSLSNEVGDTEIWELTRSADPDLADPLSQRTLLTVERDPARSSHNGGWLGFGPDGMLYITTGDGGGANDPDNNAQDIGDLRGKLLRIDVNGDDFPADAARNYAIPSGNPFAGVAGRDEIFAYGLRNPWRASFDSETGALYIADVGQNAREEVNYLAPGSGAGANFGWAAFEGSLPTGRPQAGDAILHLPVIEYQHLPGGNSITGGYVYHGPGADQGLYFFADFRSNNLWTMRVDNGLALDVRLRNDDLVTSGGTLDLVGSFAVDGRGRLYAIGLDGEIFRLTPQDDVQPPPGGSESFFEHLGGAAGGLLEAPVKLAEGLFDLF